MSALQTPAGNPDVLRVHSRDDVLVARADLTAGETVQSPEGLLAASTFIPRGHKLAATAISTGASVRKQGWSIGLATRNIAQGEHVHTHNLATALGAHESYRPPAAPFRTA
jgi:altronate hydrolase